MTQKTRDKIILTAQALIDQTGNASITLNQIAEKLGMTHAAIYKHFRNKQELWEAVAAAWFKREIIGKIHITTSCPPVEQLHAWLWAFVNAKKQTYNSNSKMFALNTQYIDNNPIALKAVLIDAYRIIDQMMGYHDQHYERAETILATFAIFTLPNFKETWNDPDYQARFERLWNLIKNGL
ncbi:TetR/AcrR family transcriptional regulator [Lactiplantibacillus sp. WILCCON 0030]|uniref:TetR/AcrR family transcriptional regulator n=1 Tax=Lactiplantibacillus brownii TaxID=3069269 RepID=A0ABU1A8E3_9LACO|nr:TetR/AcrR family transcriptional regulator [Lactiplantibacillus brownii]MDQ7936708.1 TetR/AcrR family transcriptional regulator [Lactiplantibacillus brownii]